VITEADKKKINDVNEFKDLVKDKQGSALLLKVEDGKGNSRFVGIEIPE
jgi:S1-C subfamily serine protease